MDRSVSVASGWLAINFVRLNAAYDSVKCMELKAQRSTTRDFRDDQAKQEYAATARAIARFEPVLIFVNPGNKSDAAHHCGLTVEFASLPIDDSWMRDGGPIIVRHVEGEREGIDFPFQCLRRTVAVRNPAGTARR